MSRLLITFVAIFLALASAAKMKVTATSLNVRKGPSTKYAVVGTLHKNDVVSTSSKQNGWYKIGTNKWVSGTYLASVPAASSNTPSTNTVSESKCVSASSLNVRSGPGTSNSKVSTKYNGDKVTVYEYNSDKSWARIGNNQWVSAQYLSKCGSTGGSTGTVVSGSKCNLVDGNVIDTSKAFTTGTKYGYCDDDLKFLAHVAKREQGSVNGAKIELTLMCNLYEKHKKKYSSVRNYVEKSGWFASGSRNNYSYPGDSYVSAAREVLNNGKRYMSSDVVEHDCLSDISSISTGSVSRSNFVPGKTVIKNRYGAKYMFIGFAPNKGDPFGYLV